MDEERRQHLHKLLRVYTQHLYIQEERMAKLGWQAPPSIVIEVTELRDTIVRIQAELGQFADSQDPAVIQTLYGQGLEAYYLAAAHPSVETWSRAINLLNQTVVAAPDNTHAREKLERARQHCNNWTFYKTVCQLRDKGQVQAALSALEQLERRVPGFLDPENLRAWASEREQEQAHTIRHELDRLMAAFFQAISFEEGERPAYDDIYTLFIESGLLIKNTSATPEISNVRQFIEPRQAIVSSGELTSFREIELSEITELFGNVAHRFSIYAKSGTLKGIPFEACGMISTQFVLTPAGWKISAMAWDDERPGLSIPEHYQTIEGSTLEKLHAR